MHDIIDICKKKNIFCYVVCFPVLHRLDNRYPFFSIHSALRKEVEDKGGIFIDLFPFLKGMPDLKIWVHPTDQHPNEIVHRIVAKAIVDKMVSDKDIIEVINKKKGMYLE